MAKRPVRLCAADVSAIIREMIESPVIAKSNSPGGSHMTEESLDDYMDTMAAFAISFADKFGANNPDFMRRSFMDDCGLGNFSRVLVNMRTGSIREII